MRHYAGTIAVLTIFVIAAIGLCSGLTPWVCAIRALVGAAAMYVLAKVIAAIVVSILVDVMMTNKSAQSKPGKATSEYRN